MDRRGGLAHVQLSRPGAPQRPFLLTVDPARPRVVLSLRVSSPNGHNAGVERLAVVGERRARALLQPLADLLKGAHLPVPWEGEGKRRRVRLPEEVGVRAALLVWTVAPLRRARPRHRLLQGLAQMSEEEAYYWFGWAQRGHPEDRARWRAKAAKALRILLAEE